MKFFKIRKLLLTIGFAAVMVLAAVVRIKGINLYDVHIDEITYAHFAQTIDAGQLPRDFGGRAFFLHPPGYFALLALWRAVFWHGQDIFKEYIVLRGLNIALALPTIALIMLLVKRFAKSQSLAIAAGTLFALDPFVIRQNTRSFIETSVMLWLLLGFWLLFRKVDLKHSKRSWIGIGLIFGLAVVTKDIAAIFLAVSFGAMAAAKIGPSLSSYKYLIPAVLTPYAIWVGIVAARGYLTQFLSEKTSGIRRLLGLLQETGFNAPHAPAKGGTLIETLPKYGTSYALMALGAAGAVILLSSKDVNRRRWGAIGVAASTVVAYLAIAGTFEEQFLYYLLVPAFITSTVAYRDLRERSGQKFRGGLLTAGIIGLVSLIAFSTLAYCTNLSKADDGWTQTTRWVEANAVDHSRICTWGQGQFLLGQSSRNYDVCDWQTVKEMNLHRVQYVVISETLTNSGYEPVSITELANLRQSSKLVFHYKSRDTGIFDVFELQPPLPATGASFDGSAILGSFSMAISGAMYLNSRKRRHRQRTNT